MAGLKKVKKLAKAMLTLAPLLSQKIEDYCGYTDFFVTELKTKKKFTFHIPTYLGKKEKLFYSICCELGSVTVGVSFDESIFLNMDSIVGVLTYKLDNESKITLPKMPNEYKAYYEIYDTLKKNFKKKEKFLISSTTEKTSKEMKFKRISINNDLIHA